MKTVFNDWLHWMTAKGTHFGFHRHGNCWVFRFARVRFHTCTFYTFWRFYISIPK